MQKWIAVLGIFFLLSACSMQAKLSRSFVGKDKAFLDNYYGMEGQLLELPSGQRAILYTKTGNLRSVTVNKGVTTLDPMVSPSVEKKEKFLFYIDNAGTVTACKYDLEYNR